MEKRRCTASVRTVVEFAMAGGDLLPGGQLSRMQEGTIAHRARQSALAEARTEVTVRGVVEGELARLEISGRIDALHEQGDAPIIEEIKLSGDPPPEAAIPVHRAQAICYGHLLGVPEAIIRVLYVRRNGSEAACFDERMDAAAMRAAFLSYVTPYMQMIEDRLRWAEVRDASIRALAFPFASYRTGQRDMSVQAYWAIKHRKRLFAQAPTGTGKTAAALFPALKALGEGLTGQLFYLTARTTGQQNAAQAIAHMQGSGLRLRTLCLTAKEKLCPFAQAARKAREAEEGAERRAWRCDVLTCPCAAGYFDRLPDALAAMRLRDDWSRDAVEAVAAAHGVCPFEFSLSLCEEADAVICDYNYAFDPGARIRRIFQWTNNLTLLVDEAHNLPDRAREMLSAMVDSAGLREIRRGVGKTVGRRGPLYKALTALITCVEAQEEGVALAPPDGLRALAEACMDAALAVIHEAPLGDLTLTLVALLGALERFAPPQYVAVTEKAGKHARLVLYCLDPAPHLEAATRKLRGAVYFSATLTPLHAWREAIGGGEEDGLLALPSPFPQENLLVLRHEVATTYRARERTAGAVADAILAVAQARPGNYLACFPSYAYLRRVQAEIEDRGTDVTLHVQQGGMSDAARGEYLSAFVPREEGALLGLVVLGGVFGEGVDLPGERLSGVVIVGVGLPGVGPERELLRTYYDAQYGDGFAQAYRYPGMNKVLQAVGRVIRSEKDVGVALLIDSRFSQQDYACLMPPWWAPAEVAYNVADIRGRLAEFWVNHLPASAE